MAVALQVAAGGREGKEALNEFLASPVPTQELKQMLKDAVKK